MFRGFEIPARTSQARLLSLAINRGYWPILAAVALVLPFVSSVFDVTVATLILINILGATALNMLLGVAGQVSVANGALMLTGGFTAGLIAQSGAPAIAVLVSCGLVGAIVGLCVGMPALRVRGMYLLVSSLALNYVIVYIAQLIQAHTPNAIGLTLPECNLFGVAIDTPDRWYFTLLVAASIAIVVILNLLRTDVGRSWRMIRTSESAALSLGIDVARYKLYAFVVSSTIIAITGGLYSYYSQVITSDSFSITTSVQIIAMVIVGGMSSTGGAVLGAIILTWMPYVVQGLIDGLPQSLLARYNLTDQIANVNILLYGVLVVIFILLAPDGLAGIGANLHRRISRRLHDNPGANLAAVRSSKEEKLAGATDDDMLRSEKL